MDTIDNIERRFAAVASEIQCPHHNHNARVMVDGDGPENLEVEVICCCDKLRQRVRDVLQVPVR